MKRQYMHPTMKVVEIKRRQQLLAGSNPKLGGTYGGGAVLAPSWSGSDDDDDDF